MKKKIATNFTFLLLMVNFANACSQDKELVIARVYYKFTHVKDTNNVNYPYTENMILLLSKNASVFKSYDRLISDSIMLGKIRGNNSQITSNGKRGMATQFYFFRKDKTVFEEEKLFNTYLFEIPYPSIDWKLSNDTLTIEGFKCQKALGFFRGRSYEVWFCPDLPFNAGPWKLVGLPGLVLNARDTKNQVKFELTGFAQEKNENQTITFPKNCIKTTQEQYKKLYNAFLDNPVATAKSILGADIKQEGTNTYQRPKPINNPIELKNE